MTTRSLPGRRAPARAAFRRPAVRALSLVACLAATWPAFAPPPAGAATLTWTGAVSDFASNPANWNPAQVPTAADDLVFPGTGVAVEFLRFDALVPATRSWRVLGILQHDVLATSRHTIALDLVVGDGAQFPTVTLATTDTIAIERDIEILSGEVRVQQGCRVVGVDSVRATGGNFTVQDLNSVVFAKDVLVGGPGGAAFATVSRGRLAVSQSMRVDAGTLNVGLPTARVETPTLHVAAPGWVLSALQGRVEVAGEFSLEGTLSLDDGRIAAAPLRAGATSFVGGRGQIEGPFLLEGGSVAVSNGTLVVGDAADASGVALEGTISLQPGSELECRSASPVGLPSFTSAPGGTLRSSTGFVLAESDHLVMRGLVAGDLDVTGGTLEFALTGSAAARITVEGDWSMEAGAQLLVNVLEQGAGWAAESLFVTGTAQPGGTLNVSFGFPGPGAGQALPFLFYASRPAHRVFDEVLANGTPLTNEFQVVYLADRAVLEFAGSVDVAGGPGPPAALALAGRGGREPGFALDLPADAVVTLDVYDVAGRRVAALHDGPLAAGRHRFALAPGAGVARPPASGVYFGRARVRAADGAEQARAARLVVTR